MPRKFQASAAPVVVNARRGCTTAPCMSKPVKICAKSVVGTRKRSQRSRVIDPYYESSRLSVPGPSYACALPSLPLSRRGEDRREVDRDVRQAAADAVDLRRAVAVLRDQGAG